MPPKSVRGALRDIRKKITNSHTEDKIKMPGKSNRFDFTNRANSGAKLGEIIGTTAQKEAEKVKKNAERHAAKARKLSAGSSGGVYDSATTHIIDLKAPHKALRDDGVCAMADGMEIALRGGTSLASLALEDLNLCNNGITTVSLARLAPIIKLARYDLKTINLSDNRIEVVSDEQARQWGEFLTAFKGCMKLRRLDLSGNERLGNRAVEILARVHVNEPQITPAPPGGNATVLSLVSEVGEDYDDDAEEVDSVADFESIDSKMGGGMLLPRRCGLRSIPYITLHNVGLSDAGALWLSYVVEDHFYPSQLITELNATNAESIIKAYQQNTHSRGLDWTDNTALVKEGAQLLERTEMIREHRLHEEMPGFADELDRDEDGEQETGGSHVHRGATDKTPARAKPGLRRASIRSIRTTDGGEHETSELESGRKKMMRHIIARDGASSVELWRTAIVIFKASRGIRFVAPATRKTYTGDPLFPTKAPQSPTVQPPTPVTARNKESGAGLRLDTEKAKDAKQSDRASYASKLQATTNGSGETELVITEVTNTPTTPLRLQKPTHRKGAFSEGTELESVSRKLDALVVRDDSPLRFVRFQQRRIDAKASEGKHFRDRSTTTHLPVDVLERIVGYVIKAGNLDVCSAEQRRRAIARGQDKATLTTELDWLKKDMSAQVLMLLDSIQCLHYGQ